MARASSCRPSVHLPETSAPTRAGPTPVGPRSRGRPVSASGPGRTAHDADVLALPGPSAQGDDEADAAEDREDEVAQAQRPFRTGVGLLFEHDEEADAHDDEGDEEQGHEGGLADLQRQQPAVLADVGERLLRGRHAHGERPMTRTYSRFHRQRRIPTNMPSRPTAPNMASRPQPAPSAPAAPPSAAFLHTTKKTTPAAAMTAKKTVMTHGSRIW